MRREGSGPVRALSAALLLIALLLGLAPAQPPARAQAASGGRLVATADTPFATPDLRLPTGEVAAEAPALSADGGMRPAGAANLRERPRPLAERERAPALQQSATCEPMLSNSAVDGGYDWVVLTQNVYTSDGEAYYSAPDALWFQDGAESDDDTPTEDFFGQDFYFPADAQAALIEFQIAYREGSQDSADRVFYEFFRVDADGFLVDEDGDQSNGIDPLGVGEVDEFADSSWYTVSEFVTDPAIIDAMLGQRVIFTLRGFTDDLAPFEAVYFDNIQVTACSSVEQPTGTVAGTVIPGGFGDDLSDAQLSLFRIDGAGEATLVDTTTPDRNGDYAFNNLYAPAPGEAYQVWYINSGEDERLAYWSGPLVRSFSGGFARGGIFGLADVVLGDPPHYEEAAFPVTFTWQARTGLGDRYYFCLYEADSFDEVCTQSPVEDGSYTIDAAADLQGIPGFAFAYGKDYGWYVRPVGPLFDDKAFGHIGASGYSQFVSFTQQAQTPVPPPPVEPAPPPAGGAGKSWTIMFYLAGDDEQLSHGGAGARDMVDVLTNLSTLNDSFANVNIVAQFDFYETAQKPLPADLRGTQRCYFKPGVTRLAEACQQLGELNTGDPATLAGFLSYALTNHSAQRTMLVMMGHGSTVSGVAGDQSQPAGQPDDALRPDELEAAFKQAGIGTTRKKLDLLVFYACLMGSFETAAIMSPFADSMVASPNITTLIDINRQMLGRASKSADPRAVAGGIVADYNAALTGYNQGSPVKLSIAMAAYDLRQVAAALPGVDALGAALRDNLSRDEVRAIRAAVQLYDSSAPILWGNTTLNGEDALVDLRDLANRLAKGAGVPQVVRDAARPLCSDKAAGCADGLAGLVLSRVARDGRADGREPGQHTLAGSLGLAIYFPNNSGDGNQPALTRDYLLYYRQTSFRSSQWVQLVDATRTGLPSLPRRGSLGATGGSGGTLQNFVAPELFPVAGALPVSGAGSRLYLPLLRR